jgi:hypothetical protein
MEVILAIERVDRSTFAIQRAAVRVSIRVVAVVAIIVVFVIRQEAVGEVTSTVKCSAGHVGSGKPMAEVAACEGSAHMTAEAAAGAKSATATNMSSAATGMAPTATAMTTTAATPAARQRASNTAA